MTTYNQTSTGGTLGSSPKVCQVYSERATLNPPCGCCRYVSCFDAINNSGLLPFPLPETWTVEIPSGNTTCCAFNQTFTCYYTGTLVQLANQDQPDIIAGCFPSWSFSTDCPAPNGNVAGSFVLLGLGLPSYPAGTVGATLTIGCGSQSVAYQSLHFQDGTMILDTLTGTSSSCSGFTGGSVSETLNPVGGDPTKFQISHFPATASTSSPNGSFNLTWAAYGFHVQSTFTYDSSGNFSGLTGVAGNTYSGNINFTTGAITMSYSSEDFNSGGTPNQAGTPSLSITYEAASDYPATITMTAVGTLTCPSCDDEGTTCQNYELIITQELAIAGGGGLVVQPGRYVLILGDAFTDSAGAGFTSVGCGLCQWNSNHQTGQVEFNLIPGNLSYGRNPTVATITPTLHPSQQDFTDCLWTSYMDWTIDTDDGLPYCDCPTPIDEGMYIMPYLGINEGNTKTVWTPRIGGGTLAGGAST